MCSLYIDPRTAASATPLATEGIVEKARRLTNAPRLSPPFCGTWGVWVGSGWVGVVLGARGRTALVSGGSRPPGVTPRAPPTRSAPQHAGSPPPRDYHHRFVVGCVLFRILIQSANHVNRTNNSLPHFHTDLSRKRKSWSAKNSDALYLQNSRFVRVCERREARTFAAQAARGLGAGSRSIFREGT
jgi:hypothetical protein